MLNKRLNSVKEFFNMYDNKFTLGIGNPFLRKTMTDKFIKIGGEISSTISIDAKIGHFGIEIENGCNILSGAIISNDVYLSTGVLVYFNSVIAHDCYIDDFAEIYPGAKLLGKSKVGKYSQIGSNCVVLPNINIGNNVIVEAGVIVDRDIPDNCTVSSHSAIVKKNINKM